LSKSKKVRTPGWVFVLRDLREKMPRDKAWSTEKISAILDKSVPATRRYLRVLVNAGFLLEATKGRYKYYAFPKPTERLLPFLKPRDT